MSRTSTSRTAQAETASVLRVPLLGNNAISAQDTERAAIQQKIRSLVQDLEARIPQGKELTIDSLFGPSVPIYEGASRTVHQYILELVLSKRKGRDKKDLINECLRTQRLLPKPNHLPKTAKEF